MIPFRFHRNQTRERERERERPTRIAVVSATSKAVSPACAKRFTQPVKVETQNPNNHISFQDQHTYTTLSSIHIFTWELWHAKPVTEHITEMVAVSGQEIISMSWPFPGELTEYLINHKDCTICPPKNNFLTISVHRILAARTSEDTSALFTIAIRPLIVSIYLQKNS